MPENKTEGGQLIEARISNLESTVASRIGMLEQKVDSSTKATEQGFEYLGKLLDQRFAQADQKADHTSRETRQSIEFLTEQLKATMVDQSATAIKVGFLETDITKNAVHIKNIQDELLELAEKKAAAKDVADLKLVASEKASARELAEVKGSITFRDRLFAGGAVTATIAIVTAILKDVL